MSGARPLGNGTMARMGRVIYYTAVSLDGFISDAHSALDWLFRHESDPDGALGWNAFNARIGALVMGRTTYDWLVDGPLADPGASWPHHQPCWVLTTRPAPDPLPGADVRFTHAQAAQVVQDMRAVAGARDLWCVGGGRTAAWLHAAGLLDEVWVSIAPEILGAGTPLLGAAAALELVEVSRNQDFVTGRYLVRR